MEYYLRVITSSADSSEGSTLLDSKSLLNPVPPDENKAVICSRIVVLRCNSLKLLDTLILKLLLPVPVQIHPQIPHCCIKAEHDNWERTIVFALMGKYETNYNSIHVSKLQTSNMFHKFVICVSFAIAFLETHGKCTKQH